MNLDKNICKDIADGNFGKATKYVQKFMQHKLSVKIDELRKLIGVKNEEE